MSAFTTACLPPEALELAPDGSECRPLVRLAGASLAHFRLAAGTCSRAVMHCSVEEIWYVLAGRGALWRRQDGREQVVALVAGVSVTIPLGTAFQFRAATGAALEFVAVTLPPWPGDGEALAVDGPWPASLPGADA